MLFLFQTISVGRDRRYPLAFANAGDCRRQGVDVLGGFGFRLTDNNRLAKLDTGGYSAISWQLPEKGPAQGLWYIAGSDAIGAGAAVEQDLHFVVRDTPGRKAFEGPARIAQA